MSHHLDSPIARQDVRLDITDLYVFPRRNGHRVRDQRLPLDRRQHPDARLPSRRHVRIQGRPRRRCRRRPHLPTHFRRTRRAMAGSALCCGASRAQTLSIRTRRARSSRTGAPAKSVTTSAGLRIWAGKAGDPFWIEPDVLHAVGHAFQDGTVVDLSGWNPAKAKNLFAGHTVYSIVLEVPDGSCSLARRQAPASACGLWRRSPPTPVDGVRSTAAACR